MEQAIAYLSKEEKEVLGRFDKVIIWGYPLHTHTQSYLHACWDRTFKALGKDTHWFHDDSHADPTTFSYKNCLFITEGYADTKIPLEGSSIYFVNFCIYPQKYLRSGARLFDIRFNVKEFHDVNYEFTLDDGTHRLESLSQDVLYEKLSTNSGLSKDFTGPIPMPLHYECVYMYWATDLFPWEINYEDAKHTPENKIHYVGTPYGNKRLEAFKKITEERGINWILHNPWDKPISFEANRTHIRDSILAPDFRPESSQEDIDKYGIYNGKNHLAIGYIPCRLFKNISYGHLPPTDSPHAHALLGDAVVYDKDLCQLVEKGLEAQKDVERKIRAMRLVAERHTYIHRARDLLRAILKPRPIPIPVHDLRGTWSHITLVTCLIDIQREKVDGRSFQQYIQWFVETIKIPAPMIIYVEPGLAHIVEQFRGSLPTKIIPQNAQTFPLAWSVPFVQQIQESAEWKAHQKNKHELTNHLPGYSPLQHSKMAWMLNAINENPFQTDLFFWIDGGLSRFWVPHGLNPATSEPHMRTLRNLRHSEQLYVQIGGHKEHLLQRILHGQHFTHEELIGANENILMGGFFGGSAPVLKEMCEFVLQFYVTEMIQKKRIDTELTSWTFHMQKNPMKYKFIPPHTLDMLNFLLFAGGHLVQ
jgi:hypothetical protein